MDGQAEKSLQDRVAALEKSIRNIERALEQLSTQPTPAKLPPQPEKKIPAGIPVEPVVKTPPPKPAAGPPPTSPPAVSERPKRKSFTLPENMQTSEYWLNKIGIGLLLIAVILLFKYSIDKGWLTPPIRVAFGLALGTALLIIGQRVINKKKHFGQVFMGGAVATYYITGYAAFQLFSLVSHPVAFAFMIAVTILSFFISLRQDSAIFSIIGTLGGLSTPFLLFTDSGSVPGLIIYTCFILAGTGAIYFYRGWYSLLWLSTIGGWLVFIVGISNSNTSSGHADQWAVQIGILAGWLLFWAVPVMRDILFTSYPDKLRPGKLGFGDKIFSDHARLLFGHQAILMTAVVPLISMGLSTAVWPDLSEKTWGFISIGGALVYFAVSLFLRKFPQLNRLSLTHLMVSLLYFTLALSLLLEGDTMFIALVAEAALLLIIAKQISHKGIAVFAHILFIICGLIMIDRLRLNNVALLFDSSDKGLIFNSLALTDLGAIALTLLVSVLLKSINEKRIYFIVSFTALELWLCRELQGDILFISIVALTLIMHIIAYAKKDRIVTAAAHVIFAGIIVWLAIRLFNPLSTGPALIGSRALYNLITIIATAGIVRLFSHKNEVRVYLLCGHIALLGWFLSELIRFENGQGYITIAWGIYSAVLLVIGLVKNQDFLRSIAVGTLFVVVGKLFLVDLANLEVLWRILLFMGFGGLFLFLSYYFQDLWKGKARVGDSEEVS